MKNILHNSQFDGLCLYGTPELTQLHSILNSLDSAITEVNVYHEMARIASTYCTISQEKDSKLDDIRKETLELLTKEKEVFSASVAKVLEMLDKNIRELS